MSETCVARTGDTWRRHACGKPAKGVFERGPYMGQPACGVHLAGEKRSLAATERREREEIARKRQREPAAALRAAQDAHEAASLEFEATGLATAIGAPEFAPLLRWRAACAALRAARSQGGASDTSKPTDKTSDK